MRTGGTMRYRTKRKDRRKEKWLVRSWSLGHPRGCKWVLRGCKWGGGGGVGEESGGSSCVMLFVRKMSFIPDFVVGQV